MRIRTPKEEAAIQCNAATHTAAVKPRVALANTGAHFLKKHQTKEKYNIKKREGVSAKKPTVNGSLNNDENVEHKSVGQSLHGCKRHRNERHAVVPRIRKSKKKHGAKKKWTSKEQNAGPRTGQRQRR
jgi:hypothetical protein